MANADKQFSDDAVQTLERARYLNRTAALRTLDMLRNEIGSGADVENERAAAWMAISALYKTLLKASGGADVQARWQIAIERTKAWHAAQK